LHENSFAHRSRFRSFREQGTTRNGGVLLGDNNAEDLDVRLKVNQSPMSFSKYTCFFVPWPDSSVLNLG
jgi:hypothetical protein